MTILTTITSLRMPKLCTDNMKSLSDELYDIITTLQRKTASERFLTPSTRLAYSLRGYSDYLVKNAKRMASNRQSDKPPRSTSTSFKLPLPCRAVVNVKDKYKPLNEAMGTLKDFEPLCLDNEMHPLEIPLDRKLRFEWFKDIGISYRLDNIFYLQLVVHILGYILELFFVFLDFYCKNASLYFSVYI